jgi:hypothetical protein
MIIIFDIVHSLILIRVEQRICFVHQANRQFAALLAPLGSAALLNGGSIQFSKIFA